MDNYAFDNEKTKAVYYEGSKEDWENITRFGDDFSDYIEYHVPPVYYYSETEPTTEGNYWYYDENGVPKVWEYQGE